MTYRDDHDAAIARAEALQADLDRAEADRARAEAERDRLRDRVDQLEHGPLALVGSRPTSLTHDEVAQLLVEVERAARRAQPMAIDRRVAFAFALVTAVVTVVGAFTSLAVFAIAGITLLPAIVLALASTRDGATNQPGEVVKALRDAPETITDVRVTRDGVVVETSTDTLEVSTTAPGDLERRLSLRCPNAKLT